VILIMGVMLSIVFHFVGIYLKASKIVWIAIVLFWAGAISLATSEIKPKGYEDIKSMQGKYSDTDMLIKEALPKVSLYEMIKIKNSFIKNDKK